MVQSQNALAEVQFFKTHTNLIQNCMLKNYKHQLVLVGNIRCGSILH